jgi:hypothetical protein
MTTNSIYKYADGKGSGDPGESRVEEVGFLFLILHTSECFVSFVFVVPL